MRPLAAFASVLLLEPILAGGAPLSEVQITHAAKNHDLDNNDGFSPDDQWLLFDTREDDLGIAANALIGKVNIRTGEESVVYREPNQQIWGPGVGAASYNPRDGSVVVMRGLTSASPERPYGFSRRTSARVLSQSTLELLDARNVVAPYTPGALRGGTHRPEWSADGNWIGFTYEDAILAEMEQSTGRKVNLRTFGVATPSKKPVIVPPGKENHDGSMFAVIIGRVTIHPQPGSDEIKRAFEDSWVGRNGYQHPDGHWQLRARAFLGTVVARSGQDVTEVFVADIPERLDVAGEFGPLEGTATTMPNPPRGTSQRRLTFTTERKFPGVSLTPRHWLRSSPDGKQIAYLAADDAGVTQIYCVNPQTSVVTQVTKHRTPIQSCVRWSPDGSSLLYVCAGAVTICGAKSEAGDFGVPRILTKPSAQIPESPMWSNDGSSIAFNRRVLTDGKWRKQIFLLRLTSQ